MSSSSYSSATLSTGYTWRNALKAGLIFGIVTLFIVLVGLVNTFGERDIIYNVISMGQTLLLSMSIIGGYLTGRRTSDQSPGFSALYGLIVGLTTGAVIGLYLMLASTVNLRDIFVNSSNELLTLLSFGMDPLAGAAVLVVLFGVFGAVGALISRSAPLLRRALVTGLLTVVVLGVLEDFLNVLLSTGFLKPVAGFLFARSGLTIEGAVVLFVFSTGLRLAQPFLKRTTAPAVEWLDQPGRKPVKYGLITIVVLPLLLSLPWVLQLYLSDVLDNVGLFILMGLGLNIVVGYAGLLDLGYVAFFAIGAYTTALLTSPESYLGWEWTFWEALPLAMLAAGLAGILLGVPVLRMRGDYLAIVTLGFGEIIRLLALSEALKPYIGGSTGILGVPKPVFFGIELKDAQYLYYVILAGCLIALYVSWRLSDSRIGRAWIAMREDEDVAEAMGINLVQYKLMAFATGAMFSGMAGAIFASKLGSIFPHSFNLLISINVLSLIIVGGMASLPGVFVGALILVGLPELLREFSEYRLLMYGAALVAMMLLKPEGFWPAAQRRRELRAEREAAAAKEMAEAVVTTTAE
ncbi:MAG TPA: leucine/isoleucine/valine transporter permease subunit [Chloroflexi bacterium]|nr:leucine/isoleucine/valine transporter permease subunit [Chloroflexota bacterium]